jgi:hypothetical protein
VRGVVVLRDEDILLKRGYRAGAGTRFNATTDPAQPFAKRRHEHSRLSKLVLVGVT